MNLGGVDIVTALQCSGARGDQDRVMLPGRDGSGPTGRQDRVADARALIANLTAGAHAARVAASVGSADFAGAIGRA